MAVTSYTVPWLIPQGGNYETYTNTSFNSSKVNGRLKLTVHPHEFARSRITSYGSDFNGNDCGGASPSDGFPWTASHSNEVYAKFVGKLRSGSASLGVSFASWQQTATMIVDRMEKIGDFFSLKKVSKRKSRRRPKGSDRFKRKELAGTILEGEFGWVPLLQDIHAGLVTACGEKAIPSTWVHASSRFYWSRTDDSSGSQPGRMVYRSSQGRITYSAAVAVTNPNLWLLNRLGLINPLTVAWDLVPWSFVVNMFVNVNQVLSSLSDTAGLTLSDCSQTYSSRYLREETCKWKANVLNNRRSNANVVTVRKSRVVASLPRPTLALKAPNLDWNLCVIASSLVVQKLKVFH